MTPGRVPQALHIIVEIGGLIYSLRGLTSMCVMLRDLSRHDVVDGLKHAREFRPQTGRSAKSKAGGATSLLHVADEVFNFALHFVSKRLSCPECTEVFATPARP